MLFKFFGMRTSLRLEQNWKAPFSIDFMLFGSFMLFSLLQPEKVRSLTAVMPSASCMLFMPLPEKAAVPISFKVFGVLSSFMLPVEENA